MRRAALMLPIWRALPAAALFAVIGATCDRLLKLELGGGHGRWLRWIACGLLACFAACVHPAALLLVVAVGLVGRDTIVRAAPEPLRPPAAPWRWLGATAGLLGLAVIVRPPTPLYWDAFVWLGKARIASEGFGTLRAGTLDPGGDVIPRGYPLLWPLAASWLSMFGRSAALLTAGAAATTLLALLLFLDAAASVFDSGGTRAPEELRPRWALAAGLAVLVTTPLFFVHLRSAYADLPVGLLAGTCTLRLGRELEAARPGRGNVAGAAIAAGLLVGMKDEGIAHATVIVIAAMLAGPPRGDRGARGSPAVVMAVAAIPFVGWRILLLAHGVAGGDHELGAPAFGAVGPLARVGFSSATDTETWGALWWLAIGAAGAVLANAVLASSAPERRAFRPATLLAALAFAGEAGVLVSALVLGPDRVRVFALEGTLVNRLLLQLAPPAAAVLCLAFGDRAQRAASRGDARVEVRPGATP
jgi:hypothetical protein